VACDVDNPLTGPKGAARVYGPQKGATPEDVGILEQALLRLREIFKRDFGQDLQDLAGGGAAGGLGAGLVAFCGARLRPGVDIVLSTVNLRERCRGASLLITGEGRMDGQTAYGKAPIGVAKSAKEAGVAKVLAINGSAGKGIETVLSHGIDKYYTCFSAEEMSSLSFADLAARTPARLRDLTRRALRDAYG